MCIRDSRYMALRRGVEAFSPGGFNATWANLEEAVGVTDPKNWTDDQLVAAAELLTRSRARY